MVIAGIALIAIVGALVLAAVTAALTPEPSPVPSGLAQAELSDGSILVLHGITEVSQLELPEAIESGWSAFLKRLTGQPPRTATFHGSSYGTKSLSVWLARYDARTGQPLPFDR